jgi:hypothetical protein
MRTSQGRAPDKWMTGIGISCAVIPRHQRGGKDEGAANIWAIPEIIAEPARCNDATGDRPSFGNVLLTLSLLHLLRNQSICRKHEIEVGNSLRR